MDTEEYNEETDLFNLPELIPAEVKAILNTWKDEGNFYEQCERMLTELKPLGYTFNYGLDGTPYNLQKIN